MNPQTQVMLLWREKNRIFATLQQLVRPWPYAWAILPTPVVQDTMLVRLHQIEQELKGASR